MKRFTGILLALMFLASSAFAADVFISWNHPTYGTTPVTYVTQLSDDGGVTWVDSGTAAYPDTVVPATIPENVEYVCRVRAIDIDGHEGIWSETSPPYIYGVPGQPGAVWIEEAN